MSLSSNSIGDRSDFSDVENVWSRRFFNAASITLEPACSVLWRGYRIAAPLKEFGKNNVIREVALRIFYSFEAILLAIPSLPLAIISLPLRSIGWMLQKNEGYTHVRGSPEVTEKNFEASSLQVKVMTFNIAGVPGGISYQVAGMPHWQSRIEGIVKIIKEAEPDLLVIEEAYDTALQEELVDRLKALYPHFFLHLGVGAFGGLGPGGIFMATKGAISHFSDHPFLNNPYYQCRSFGSIEMLDKPEGRPFARFIGIHLTWRKEEKEIRTQQWSQIQEYIKKRNSHLLLPTIIAGDTNTERDQEEGQHLQSWALPFYSEKAPTCSDKFPAEWNRKEPQFNFGPNMPRQIDNILHVLNCGPKVQLIECKRIESYLDDYSQKTDCNLFDSSSAVSDHHAVVAKIKFEHRC